LTQRRSLGALRKIDSLGRVVIPSEVRDALGLAAGDRVEIETCDGAIVMRHVRHRTGPQ
jgi:AbrB family looped-hinge helix DNA binding protein